MERAHKIDLHHEPHLLQVLLIELLRREHPVVTHQYVDGTGGLQGLGDGVGIPHVGAESGDLDAGGESDGVAGLLEAGSAAGEDGDAGALDGGLAGEGEADPAGASGDEDVAAFDGDVHRAGADEEGKGSGQGEERNEEEEEEKEKKIGHGDRMAP